MINGNEFIHMLVWSMIGFIICHFVTTIIYSIKLHCANKPYSSISNINVECWVPDQFLKGYLSTVLGMLVGAIVVIPTFCGYFKLAFWVMVALSSFAGFLSRAVVEKYKKLYPVKDNKE